MRLVATKRLIGLLLLRRYAEERYGSQREVSKGEGGCSLPIELRGVEANGLVESRPLVVVEVHGHVYGQAEEAGPELGLPVVQELRAEESVTPRKYQTKAKKENRAGTRM